MLAGEPELVIVGTFETPWGNHVYLWCRWCRDGWCFAPYNHWRRDGARQLVQCPTCHAARTMPTLLDDVAAMPHWPPAIEKRPESGPTGQESAREVQSQPAPPAAAPAPRPAPPPAVDPHTIPPPIPPEPAIPIAPLRSVAVRPAPALDEPEPEVAPFMPALPAVPAIAAPARKQARSASRRPARS